MEQYFKIPLEFNHEKLEKTVIDNSLENKGYCCFVDSNTLTEAHKKGNNLIGEVLNNALVNSCDGAYVAMMASLFYKKKYKAYSGPEFFSKFIHHEVSQCIIGNTYDVFKKIEDKIIEAGDTPDLHFIPLPFKKVDEFDYVQIAREINNIKPKYIWVSLGAPKQEIFMYNLLPFINKGIMLGVGAALNYFSGTIKPIPPWAKQFRLIWFYRILTEPSKQIIRIYKIIRYYPTIFF